MTANTTLLIPLFLISVSILWCIPIITNVAALIAELQINQRPIIHPASRSATKVVVSATVPRCPSSIV
jgi:hypothetical protein